MGRFPPPDACPDALLVLVFALIAALFVSGVIGRAVHASDAGCAAVIADAGFGISEIHLPATAARA